MIGGGLFVVAVAAVAALLPGKLSAAGLLLLAVTFAGAREAGRRLGS